MSAKVGVIIPTYTIERYIGATLDGLLAQTHENWEAVVVDDGSTDATVDILRRYAAKDPRIRVLTQRNQGGAAARENGFDHLSDDVEAVLFFDHDDVLRPHALSLLVDALRDHHAAYGLAAYIDPDGKPYKPGRYEAYLRGRRKVVSDHKEYRLQPMDLKEPMTYEGLVVNNWVPIGAILMRKDAKIEAGRFDPNTNYAHDWDMWIRLSLLGPIAFVNEVIYDYRVHPTAMSRSGTKLDEGQQDVWAKYVHADWISAEQREIALRAFELVHAEQLAIKTRKAWRRFARLQFAEGKSLIRDAKSRLNRFRNQT